MGLERFKHEFPVALTTLRSVYLGKRDVVLSDAITSSSDIDTMKNVAEYFRAFKSYSTQALHAHHLDEEQLDIETKELFTKHEVFAQLVQQRLQALQVEQGDVPIYQSH